MYKPVPGSSSQAEQKAIKRQIAHLGTSNAKTYHLEKVYTVTKDDKDKSKPPRTWDLPLITGEALTKFPDRNNHIYIRNITLVDRTTGQTFLQRFGPATETALENMGKSFNDGWKRFQTVMETASCKRHKAETRQTPDQQQRYPHYHFGGWYDRFGANLGLTTETKQAGNEQGKDAVSHFCVWFKQYIKQHIQPIMKPNTGLCDAFRSELEERINVHFPWANKQIEGLERYCHLLYSTISPFLGFSGNVHVDDKDADVSILVNFGQHALLQLPEYGCAVVLQPLDTVFFLSNSVHHLTAQHQAHIKRGSDPGARMAITCFFRKALQQHQEPTKHSHLYYAQKAEEEQEAERQAKRWRQE